MAQKPRARASGVTSTAPKMTIERRDEIAARTHDRPDDQIKRDLQRLLEACQCVLAGESKDAICQRLSMAELEDIRARANTVDNATEKQARDDLFALIRCVRRCMRDMPQD